MQMRVLAIAMSALLGACASTARQAYDAEQAGRYSEAYTLYNRCASDGVAGCMHNIGAMYENGKLASTNPKARAIGWYTLAARHGFGMSQVALMRLGADIPSADMVAPEATQAEMDAAGAVGRAVGTAIGTAAGRRH